MAASDCEMGHTDLFIAVLVDYRYARAQIQCGFEPSRLIFPALFAVPWVIQMAFSGYRPTSAGRDRTTATFSDSGGYSGTR